MYLANIFSQSVACLIILFTMSFTENIFLNFNKKSSLSIIAFMDPAFSAVSKDSLLYPMLSRFSPMLSSRRFIVLHLHLGLWSIWVFLCVCEGVRSMYRFIFCLLMSTFQATVFEKTVFAPMYCFSSFVKHQLTIFIWVCFWALYSVLLIYLSLLLPIPHFLDYCSF